MGVSSVMSEDGKGGVVLVTSECVGSDIRGYQ